MTPSPLLTPGVPADLDPVTEDLQRVLFGSDWLLYERAREAMLAVRDVPVSGLTGAEQAARAPDLLRTMIREMGGSALDIAADPRTRGTLFEGAGIAGPSTVTLLSGHIGLTSGLLVASGTNSEYVRGCAAALDTGEAVGVFGHTELGGTNGPNCRTTAIWDEATGRFRLSTPDVAAAKFMPNVADSTTAKIVVVTARVNFRGRDEGVFPFLLWLRDAHGRLAPGVRVVPLADKNGSAMDHAMFGFPDGENQECWLPPQALVGRLAHIGADGEFHCALPHSERFARTIGMLEHARLDLPAAAVAMASTALAGVMNYGSQRCPGDTVLIERGIVKDDLATGVAAIWATSILGRRLRDLVATGSPAWSALWPMVAKPLLSDTAFRVLDSCITLAGAQGVLRDNFIADGSSNARNIRIAEGANPILLVTAGKAGEALLDLQIPGTPAHLPPDLELLIEREHAIAAAIARGDFGAPGPVRTWDSAAAELATATGERLAATAVTMAASTAIDPTAAHLLDSTAAAYRLDLIYQRGGWYCARKTMTCEQMAQTLTDLTRHRGIVADHLLPLVAAFGIPRLPGAPMFAHDYLEPYQHQWDQAHSTPSTENLDRSAETVAQEHN